MVVLITGANGQLGQSFYSIANDFSDINFYFRNSKELDITNDEQVTEIFNEIKPNFCINCAAYTAVDKAESEPEKAHQINVKGVENLAIACEKTDTTLIHISTDFIFDGTKNTPYLELDTTNPLGIYGKTKLVGEEIILKTWEKHIIIRTSWVYSQFGNNFLKTMLRLGAERTEISVVNDQIGTPTNAVDLAFAILKIIQNPKFGIYNYSNLGVCSWFDFAQKIFQISNNQIVTHPILTSQYPTPAQRPKYSVLDKTKITETFDLEIPYWETSLENTIKKMV
jgi:dTDP-4-dehydrorhamnose reductase